MFGNDIQQEESNDGQSLETESEDHFDDTGSDESHITQVNSGINENDITDSDTDTDVRLLKKLVFVMLQPQI